MDEAEYDERSLRREPRKEEEMERVEHTRLAVGEQRIATEYRGRPERQLTMGKRMSRCDQEWEIEDFEVVFDGNHTRKERWIVVKQTRAEKERTYAQERRCMLPNARDHSP